MRGCILCASGTKNEIHMADVSLASCRPISCLVHYVLGSKLASTLGQPIGWGEVGFWRPKK